MLSSCGAIFNEVVMPNHCKRCQVVNIYTNQVLWSDEGCGGETAGMEDDAKIQAYEQSRLSNNLCEVEVRCETWRAEEDKKDN